MESFRLIRELHLAGEYQEPGNLSRHCDLEHALACSSRKKLWWLI
jgi:hypothetical protein